MIKKNILKTIYNTPIVQINNIENNANIYVKVESFNPGGSVKDRIAYNMIVRKYGRSDVINHQNIHN